MNIDERQVITEAAEIGLDMAPIPTPAKGLLGGLIGKLFGRKN
jgi:hypothetical protein